MIFDQLKDGNIRNTFFEKTCTKCGEEASPNSFSKKSKLSIFLDQHSEILYSLILLYVQVENYQNTKNITVFDLLI